MTADLAWPLALGSVAALWLLLRFVARERRARRADEARQALHRERMAALERGIELPAWPPAEAPEEPAAGRRLAPPSWDSVMLGLGLVLLFAGLGAVVGYRLVPETPQTLGMQELASLGLVPAMAGAGLVLYAVLLRRAGRGER